MSEAARVDGRITEQADSSIRYEGPLERAVLIAKLKPGAYERAQELASAEVSTEVDGAPGLRRFIFLSPTEVVFLVEGDDLELRTREWFDDPVRSGAIGHWLPLFDGALHSAREVPLTEPDDA